MFYVWCILRKHHCWYFTCLSFSFVSLSCSSIYMILNSFLLLYFTQWISAWVLSSFSQALLTWALWFIDTYIQVCVLEPSEYCSYIDCLIDFMCMFFFLFYIHMYFTWCFLCVHGDATTFILIFLCYFFSPL